MDCKTFDSECENGIEILYALLVYHNHSVHILQE